MAFRNNRERRSGTPTALKIFKYWSQEGKLPPIKNDKWLQMEERTCFACGHFFYIQRCHIISLCDGGENTVDNLHLLCSGCHSASEGNKKYWNWLTYMRTYEWKSRYEWTLKILEMNGVNMAQEMEKNKDLNMQEVHDWFKNLCYENGIGLTPKKEFLFNKN